ncbi:hypothetical protein J7T55_013758 [Diaporthe amygdali]|uniref:uncharacterized protein n=1 Tax=Phomopsis amygdali TaxID=1214568 RepID=UPI0022FEA70B|nr:uncharacterized protein J7T55_013758 [Diaporthe amygdali]KAJ0119555.1 hypothetical protein J7T55_013758 [Diaporthe amygdali]
MAIWLLLCFWCLFATGLRVETGLVAREDSKRAVDEYFIDPADPSYCIYFTYTYFAPEGAPSDYSPLPPYGQPTGLPGPVTTAGSGSGPVSGLPGGVSTGPGGGGITTGPQGTATVPGGGTVSPGQSTANPDQSTIPGQGTVPGQGTASGQSTVPGQGTGTSIATTTSSGSITGPTPAAPAVITAPGGRSFSINLRQYLAAPTDRVLSVTTQPEVPWTRLADDILFIDAPEVLSENTLLIRLRAANAAGVPYEVVLTLKLEPVIRVPITPDSIFSIDLNRYLGSSSDTVNIVTEPPAPWVGYVRANQRIGGRVPAGYNTSRTLVTANVVPQNGPSYARYFALVIAPVSVIPLTPGSQFTTQLGSFLLTSTDVITSVNFDPKATWVNFDSSAKTFSGPVPATLDVNSIIATLLATSSDQGLEYSFQLELYVQDSNQVTSIQVPVVASNKFSISTKKYFPASVELTSITTNPAVNWISFNVAQNTVSGLVPDLMAGTTVNINVNASSAGAPGSSAATYSKLFTLQVQANDVPKFNVTLGSQFVINLGASLLSPPGDYLTAASTVPESSWVSLGSNGKTLGGIVPINLAAGTSVAVTGNVFNPSLDSSYTKEFSLQILAGSDISVPVLLGGDFQVNLTDFLRGPDDTLQVTTTPPVPWVRISPSPPPSLIGTVPLTFTESEVNITIIATSKMTGFTYTILSKLLVFTNEVKVEVFQSDIFFVNLVPLLKTAQDEVESIATFPRADWLTLDRGNRSVSGIVPLNQPPGSSVNITVNGLSLVAPDSRIGRLRGAARIVPRQDRVLFPYSVLVSVKIFDRPVVNSTSAVLPSTEPPIQPPSSGLPQPSGPVLTPSESNPPSPSVSGGDGSGTSGPEPSGAASDSSVLPPPSGSGGPEPTGPDGSSQVSPGPSANPSDGSASPSESGGSTTDDGQPQPTGSGDGGVLPEPTPQSSGDVQPEPTPQSSGDVPPPGPTAQSSGGADHALFGDSSIIRSAQPGCVFDTGLFGYSTSTKHYKCCPATYNSHLSCWEPDHHPHLQPAWVKRSRVKLSRTEPSDIQLPGTKYSGGNLTRAQHARDDSSSTHPASPWKQLPGAEFSGHNLTRPDPSGNTFTGTQLTSYRVVVTSTQPPSSRVVFASIQSPSSWIIASTQPCWNKLPGAESSGDYLTRPNPSRDNFAGAQRSGNKFSSAQPTSSRDFLPSSQPSRDNLAGAQSTSIRNVLTSTQPSRDKFSRASSSWNLRPGNAQPASRYVSGPSKPIQRRSLPIVRAGHLCAYKWRTASKFWAIK